MSSSNSFYPPQNSSSYEGSSKFTTVLRMMSGQETEPEFVLVEHSYARPWNWQSESSNSHPRKTLFMSKLPRQEKEDVVDVEKDFSSSTAISYDLVRGQHLMSECERHVEFAKSNRNSTGAVKDEKNVKDKEETDWEETVNKAGWTETQHNLFNRVVKILDSDRLAKLTLIDTINEAIKRRAQIDKTSAKFRQTLGRVNWDLKLTQWLHNILLHNLSTPYLAAYLDILQTLKSKIPNLVDKMITLSTTHKGANIEALNLLLKRPWDPAVPVLNQQKPCKLETQPIFIQVPSGTTSPNVPQASRRIRFFNSQLQHLAKCIPVSVMSETSDPEAILEQLMSEVQTRIAECKAQYPSHPIILLGWGIGAVLACYVSLIEKVSANICLGFPMSDHKGQRGEADDPLLDMRTPTLFITGQKSANACVEDLEDFRYHMPAETSLVVIAEADLLLRMSLEKRYWDGLTQSMVDRCLVDEIGDFLTRTLNESSSSKPASNAPISLPPSVPSSATQSYYTHSPAFNNPPPPAPPKGVRREPGLQRKRKLSPLTPSDSGSQPVPSKVIRSAGTAISQTLGLKIPVGVSNVSSLLRQEGKAFSSLLPFAPDQESSSSTDTECLESFQKSKGVRKIESSHHTYKSILNRIGSADASAKPTPKAPGTAKRGRPPGKSKGSASANVLLKGKGKEPSASMAVLTLTGAAGDGSGVEAAGKGIASLGRGVLTLSKGGTSTVRVYSASGQKLSSATNSQTFTANPSPGVNPKSRGFFLTNLSATPQGTALKATGDKSSIILGSVALSGRINSSKGNNMNTSGEGSRRTAASTVATTTALGQVSLNLQGISASRAVSFGSARPPTVMLLSSSASPTTNTTTTISSGGLKTTKSVIGLRSSVESLRPTEDAKPGSVEGRATPSVGDPNEDVFPLETSLEKSQLHGDQGGRATLKSEENSKSVAFFESDTTEGGTHRDIRQDKDVSEGSDNSSKAQLVSKVPKTLVLGTKAISSPPKSNAIKSNITFISSKALNKAFPSSESASMTSPHPKSLLNPSSCTFMKVPPKASSIRLVRSLGATCASGLLKTPSRASPLAGNIVTKTFTISSSGGEPPTLKRRLSLDSGVKGVGKRSKGTSTELTKEEILPRNEALASEPLFDPAKTVVPTTTTTTIRHKIDDSSLASQTLATEVPEDQDITVPSSLDTNVSKGKLEPAKSSPKSFTTSKVKFLKQIASSHENSTGKTSTSPKMTIQRTDCMTTSIKVTKELLTSSITTLVDVPNSVKDSPQTSQTEELSSPHETDLKPTKEIKCGEEVTFKSGSKEESKIVSQNSKCKNVAKSKIQKETESSFTPKKELKKISASLEPESECITKEKRESSELKVTSLLISTKVNSIPDMKDPLANDESKSYQNTVSKKSNSQSTPTKTCTNATSVKLECKSSLKLPDSKSPQKTNPKSPPSDPSTNLIKANPTPTKLPPKPPSTSPKSEMKSSLKPLSSKDAPKKERKDNTPQRVKRETTSPLKPLSSSKRPETSKASNPKKSPLPPRSRVTRSAASTVGKKRRLRSSI